MKNKQLLLGIDNLILNDFKELQGKKIAVLVNQASFSSNFEYTHNIILNNSKSNNYSVINLFSPQHGLFSTKQANMIESDNCSDRITSLEVKSLYGKNRSPEKKDLDKVDSVVIDLFDVGARYYTYVWTMALMMKECEKYNKEIIILDRPNPLNGITVEGNIQDDDFLSFVGLYKVPVRHSLTIGEMATYLKYNYFKNLNINIIKMQNYNPEYYYCDYNIVWNYPSPNMPSFDTALTYPGMCLFEGTNVSEGRGTTKPFEIFGSPWIDEIKLSKLLNDLKLPGVHFRPLKFCPTFDKYKNEICNGIFIHITDKKTFQPYKMGIIILQTIKTEYPEHFNWYLEPYEYEYEKLAIDILCGTDIIRKIIDNNENISYNALTEMFKKDEDTFKEKIQEIKREV